MRNYIAIDGGTTNTRVGLMCGETVVETLRLPIGAGAAVEDRTAPVKAIEGAIRTLLEKHPDTDIEQVLVAGMLTSEFGLLEVPHLPLPAGVAELHAGLVHTEMLGLPMSLVPGVRSTLDDPFTTNMMRGEESELMGLMAVLPPVLFEDSVVVLPGSHSKFIYTDSAGRITSFLSLMTGEMLAALSGHTILRDAVTLCDEYDEGYLKRGYDSARAEGLNAALLRVRTLKNLFGTGERELYSFFLGAVLEGEITHLAACPASRIVLAGRKQIKEPMAALLRALCDKPVYVVDDAAVRESTFRGMKAIFEYK